MSSDLVEGLHYSIMFYGGRLLSHLSSAGDDVGRFIKLRSLNRNFAIVMDSDRDRKGRPINETKRRIRREVEEHGGMVWVTQGREIENYVPFEQMQAALKETHPRIYGFPHKEGVYEHAFYFHRKTRVGRKGRLEDCADKVRIAHHVTSNSVTLDVMDLKSRVSALARSIKEANGLNG